MRCKTYIIVTLYLDQRAPWTRSLRELASSGATIVYKDEITRRIVVRLAPGELSKLVKIIEGRLAAEPVVEVKAYCKGVSVEALSKRLAELGFRRTLGPRGKKTYLGILLGRLVFLEAWGSKVTVKVGVKTESRRPSTIPPPSAFQHSLDEAKEAAEAARSILDALEV